MEQECDCPKSSGGAPAWMATFGDMMSLLLTFFVLLLSFANMDVVKFKEMIGSVQDALGVKTIEVGSNDARSSSLVELSDFEETPLIEQPDPREAVRSTDAEEEAERAQDRELHESIEKVINEKALHSFVEAVPGERGVTIRVKGNLMFGSGTDKLKLSAEALLYQIAEIAKEFPYHLAVEGHTDDTPTGSSTFGTNWHLSAARAIAGVEFLAGPGGISPSRLSATGYGATRPIARGISARSRAKNRRLEFVFYRPDQMPQGEPNAEEAEKLALPGFDL